MDGAMFKPFYCVGGAAIKLALSIRTVLEAKTTFSNSSFTSFHFALFLGVHVLLTPSSRLSGRGAPFPRAEPVATMCEAQTTSVDTTIASISGTDAIATMFRTKASSNSGAAAACSRALHFA